MEWNDIHYKPTTKLHEIFWEDFLHVARLLLILDRNKTKEEKARASYREPDIYAVFNKIRQDELREQPYDEKSCFIRGIDRSIAREMENERKASLGTR